MHKTLIAITLAALLTGCAATAKEPKDIWSGPAPDPDSFRYVIHEKVDGKWQEAARVNKDAKRQAKHRCYILPEPWRGATTTVRLEDRRTGESTTFDCNKIRS